jgi:hypothetical protein
MNHHLTSITESRERQLSALNAKAEALSMRDATAWDEAVDWGAPDFNLFFNTLYPAELRSITAADAD